MSAGKGRGGKEVVLLCCEATAVLPQTHRQCQVVEVWQHQGLLPQRVGGGREEGEERHENGLHPGHIPYTVH